MKTNLKGKTAIITGGAMGIGMATCKRLIKEGCSVTVWDLNEKALQKAEEELAPLNGRLWFKQCDAEAK